MQIVDIQRCTQREAAAAFGVTDRTLRAWTDAGAPRNADAGRTYSLPALVAWRIQIEAARAETAEAALNDDAMQRYRAARARLAEIDVAERERTVIPLDYVNASVGRVMTVLKNRILGLPTKLAATCAALDRPEDVFEELTTECREVLTDARADLLRISGGGETPASGADSAQDAGTDTGEGLAPGELPHD